MRQPIEKELLFQSERTRVVRVTDANTKEQWIIKSRLAGASSSSMGDSIVHEYEMLERVKASGSIGVEPHKGGILFPVEQLVFDGLSSIRFPDVGGASLLSLLARPIDFDLFFNLALSLIRTLERVHHAGIIHKDINPTNIISSRDFSRAWLIDFSLSIKTKRELHPCKSLEDLAGTLDYLPPEQSGRINRSFDYRADYYSLGITFFELLSGRKPFQSDELIGLLHAHLTEPLPRLEAMRPDVPRSLAQVVEKLAAKDPDDRYQSASGIISDLEQARVLWKRGDLTATFELGRNDFSERFSIPDKIVGREKEIGWLLGAFDKLQNGDLNIPITEPAPRLILLGGRSGVGKSSLVHQLARPIALKKGYLLEGKIDQYQQDGGLSGFKNGLLTYFDLLSGDSMESFREFKNDLARELRNNVGVITAHFPELGPYLGEFPAPAPRGPREARALTIEVFVTLFREICSRRPVVFFIDDLQWADAATFDLIEAIVDESISGLMLLGAFRSNEVGEEHALTRLAKKLGDQAGIFEVSPLGSENIQELLSACLGPVANLSQIAAIFQQKTGGNAFFVHQLLQLLYSEGAISRDAAARCWQLDLARLNQLQVADNVLDFLLNKFSLFDPEVRDLLTFAAALGTNFRLDVIARAMSKTSEALDPIMRRVIDEEIVCSAGKGTEFKFNHDRLQQAAYELKSQPGRGKIHLRIAEALFEEWRTGLGGNLTESAEHYLLADLADIDALYAQKIGMVLFDAAVFARRALSFKRAFEYLRQAEGLLIKFFADDAWVKHRQLMRRILKERIEVSLLASEGASYTQKAEELLQRSQTAEERVEAFRMLSYQAYVSGDHKGSIDYGLECLALAGIKVAKVPSPFRIALQLVKVFSTLSRLKGTPKGIAGILDTPSCTDARQAEVQYIITLTAQNAFLGGNKPLAHFLLFFSFGHQLKIGLTSTSPKAVGVVSMGLFLFGKLQLAKELAEVANKLSFHPASTDRRMNIDGRGIILLHAFYYLSSSELKAEFEQNVEGALDEQEFSAHHNLAWMVDFVAPTQPLSQLAQFVAPFKRLVKGKSESALKSFYASHHFFELLFNKDPKREQWIVDDYQNLVQSVTGQNASQVVYLRSHLGAFLFLLGRVEEAYPILLDCFFSRSIMFSICPIQIELYYVLSLLSLRRKEGRSLSLRERYRVKQVLKHFSKLNQFNAKTFGSYFTLVQAESLAARVKSGADKFRVISAYQKAIRTVENSDHFLLKALTYERTSEFHRSCRHASLADFYLKEAHKRYRDWEAWAKVKQLEVTYPDILTFEKPLSQSASPLEASTSVELGQLDLTEVLKAARSIASEVVLSRLVKKILQVVLEVSGAERGVLLLRDGAIRDGEFPFSVSAGVDRGSSLRMELRDLPLALLERTRLKKEAQIIENANSDEILLRDLSLRDRGVRSIACLPTLKQGEVVAVLYLENNQMAGAFTRDRVKILEVLSSQVAVSIENAKLYSTLEEKVQEKTRDIQTIFGHIQQGIFALTSELKIHPEYSTHLEAIFGMEKLSGRDPFPILLNHPRFSANAESEIRAALESILDEPVLNFDVNAHLLPKRLVRLSQVGTDQELEVDWRPLVSSDGMVERVLVTLRDVTELNRLQREAEVHKTELEMMGEVMDCGLESFEEIERQATQGIAESRKILNGFRLGAQASLDAISSLFRVLHTLKGTTRTFGLSFMVDAVHEAEEFLDQMRKGAGAPVTSVQLERMERDLAQIETRLRRYSEVIGTKLHALRDGGVRGVESIGSQLVAELRRLGPEPIPPEEGWAIISKFHKNLHAASLGELLRPEIDSLSSLSKSLGKASPQLKVADEDQANGALLFRVDRTPFLREVITHCLRNSMDHGLEAPAERKSAGKSDSGTISLLARRGVSGGVELEVSDDGRGLNLEELREKGIKEGLLKRGASDEEAAEVIFSSGMTTAERVSEISGRGVGLDAVKKALEHEGGEVRISFLGTRDAFGRRPFKLVLALPAGFLYDEGSNPSFNSSRRIGPQQS